MIELGKRYEIDVKVISLEPHIKSQVSYKIKDTISDEFVLWYDNHPYEHIIYRHLDDGELPLTPFSIIDKCKFLNETYDIYVLEILNKIM